MRRYLRVVALGLVCGFCSLLYAFSQLAAGPERGADGEPRAAVASWLAGGGRGAGSGAGSAGPAARPAQADRHVVPKPEPAERMHLAVVACGERLEETLTMLKSAIIFSIKPLQFHIFAEEQLHDSFKGRLDSWARLQNFNYTLYPVTFPPENAAEWKKLFKPCASQRLFLPLILKEVDSLLYVDTDILFLRPVDDIWSLLKKFNSTQIAAMAPEHEEPRIGWYNRFARHPYYGETGINSGVMLMNMTRMRRKYFKKTSLIWEETCRIDKMLMKKSIESANEKTLEHLRKLVDCVLARNNLYVNDMTTTRLRWGDVLVPLLKKYKLNITWGDQDLLNIMFFHNPESLFVFPCQWNYRPDHCIYGSNCRGAEEEGVSVLHGNRGVYHDDKQPAFRAVYEALRNCSVEDASVRALLQPLELALRKTVHTYCGRSYGLFIKQLARSVRDRSTRLPRAT